MSSKQVKITDLAPLTTCKDVQVRLRSMYADLGTWAAVGDALDVSGTMAYRVAKEGYQPRDPAIRAKLGLPALTEKLAADLLTELVAREPVEG